MIIASTFILFVYQSGNLITGCKTTNWLLVQYADMKQALTNNISSLQTVLKNYYSN